MTIKRKVKKLRMIKRSQNQVKKKKEVLKRMQKLKRR
jgi:hypothetical protein